MRYSAVDRTEFLKMNAAPWGCFSGRGWESKMTKSSLGALARQKHAMISGGRVTMTQVETECDLVYPAMFLGS